MQLTVLLQDEVRAIHQATLRILSEVGVFLDDDEARTLLFDNGAEAHHEAERILATHQVPPLPEDQARAMDEIMHAAVSEQTGKT